MSSQRYSEMKELARALEDTQAALNEAENELCDLRELNAELLEALEEQMGNGSCSCFLCKKAVLVIAKARKLKRTVDKIA